MKLVNKLPLLFIVFLFSQCTSYKVTKMGNSEIVPSSGMVYSLPKTAIKVNVSVSKETTIKGPFAEYAEKLLGLKNIITVNQTAFHVVGIDIETSLIPDTAYQYIITKKSFPLRKHKTTFNYNNSGLLVGVNTNSKFTRDTSSSHFSMAIKQESVAYSDFFKLYADASQIEKIDTVYEIVKTDSVVMSKPIIKRTLVTKTVQQRAEETADYILKFRMKRYELIAANQEIPYSKESFEYMNNQLMKIENEYMELFTGISYTETQQFSFLVIPDKSNTQIPINLFNFSEEFGVTDNSDSNSQQYAIGFEPMNLFNPDTVIAKKRVEIPYRNPIKTKVYILLNGEILPHFFEIPIFQFGRLNYFPKNVKSILFDENTGMVKRIIVK